MNRKTKRLLIGALIVFALGSLITLGSYIFAVASDLDIYGNSDRSYDFASYTLTLADLKSVSNAGDQEIAQLQINTQASNVRVVRTDGISQIEFHRIDQNNLVFDFTSGILSISEPNSVNYYGLTVENGSFSFHGLRHLFHQAGFQTGREIVIRWNPADPLKSLHLNSTVGDVTVEDVEFSGDLTIASTVGHVRVKNSVSPNADLVVRLSVGNIDYADSEFSMAALNTTVGEIRAARIDGSMSAETVVGRISLRSDRPLTSFSIRATTTVGSVHVPEKGSVGASYHQSGEDNTPDSIALECTVGPIYLEKIDS